MVKEEKTEVKKNNYSLIIIIALVFLLGLGTGYLLTKKESLIKKEDSKIEKKEEVNEYKKELEKDEEESSTVEEKKEETNPNEKIITDSYAIKSLDKKLEILNGYQADWVSPAPGLYRNIKNKDMKDGEKIYMILLYNDKNEKFTKATTNSFNNLTGENITGWDGTDNITELYINDDDGMYHFMDKSKVEQEYKELFGNLPNTTKVINGYPTYYYEPNAKAYFQIARGGGTCGTYFYQYNYKFTEDESNAYIYTTVAYYSCDVEIFNDKKLKQSVGKVDIDENDTKIEKNYAKEFKDELDKYRVIFKKDRDNYIFDRVEKL